MKKILFSLALLPALTVSAFAVTVFNSDGSLRYSDDPSVTATVNGAVSEFLTKPFEEYTVTEGFLLLFLLLGVCVFLWKIIKGVFEWLRP